MRERPSLTLDDCKLIAAAAEAEALKNKWNVAIAILDDGGHLMHFQRMDGATAANAEIALGKGRTAAISQRASGMWEERIKAGRLSTLAMPLLAVQGGLPITVNKDCVGAVGVSGVQSHEDEQVAKVGIDALLKTL